MKDQDLIFYASLLHDLGKLYQRAFPRETSGTELKKHPKLAMEIIEKTGLEKWFPDFDELLQLIAHHHEEALNTWEEKGRLRYLAEIISEGDNLSSGERESGDLEQTPLIPILSKVSGLKEASPPPSGKYFHKYRPLNLDEETLFPEEREKIKDPDSSDLQRLAENLAKELKNLVRKSSVPRPEAVYHIIEKYTWCVPSAYFKALTDVSLFDHSRTTAAIAIALYRQLENQEGTLISSSPQFQRKVIKDRKEVRYALLCGDLSGIQSFIYRITSKGASKGLKGRSFYVQMVTHSACRNILKELDLPISQVIYLGGGRFYLLLPRRLADKALEVVDSMNKELFQKFNGALFLAAGYQEFSGEEFKEFPELWRKAGQTANKAKEKRFSFIDPSVLFNPQGDPEKPEICQVCGAEPEDKSKLKIDKNGRVICCSCEEQEKLGQKLRRFEYLAEVDGKGDFTLFNTSYCIASLGDLEKIGNPIKLYLINDTDMLNKLPLDKVDGGFLFYGGNWAPESREESIKTFNELARESQGIKRLGVLRMDVDDLGKVFMTGLGSHATLSRLASLSRMLGIFFNGYINTLLKPYKECAYLIYSGGDDIFLIAPWSLVPEIALKIHDQFSKFSCHNPHLSLSGGAILVPEKYPLYKAAQLAGEAEDRAKDFQRPNKWAKDAFNFLGLTVGWEELKDAKAFIKLLYKVKEQNEEKLKPVLNRLFAACESYSMEKKKRQKRLKGEKIDKEQFLMEVYYSRWKWMLVYSLSKIGGDIKDILRKVQYWVEDKGPLRNRIDYLYLPVRWLDLLERREKNA